MEKKRSVDQIALEELAEGAFICMKSAYSLSPKDLIKETTKLFGLKVNARTRERIIASVRLLEKEKRIQWRGNKVRITKD